MSTLGGKISIVNNLRPSKNGWAYDLFIKAANNNWLPVDISMAQDIELWKSKKLTADERLLVKRILGFFSASESLVGNNLLLTVFRYINDGELRLYITRQAFEESLHSMTVSYVSDSLNLDIEEIYNGYVNIKAIRDKDQFLMSITKDINRKDFDIETLAGKRELLRNLVTYYIICEGIFFYGAFAAILSFKRRNLFQGLCEQINYSLRDENLHLEFGINLIGLLRKEYPELWDEQFENETLEHIKTACELEIEFCREALPKGVMGLNSKVFLEYVRYLTDRRCQQIGLPIIHGEVRNPFEWMTEVTDLPKMKNFFETKVQEYSTGGLVDDL